MELTVKMRPLVLMDGGSPTPLEAQTSGVRKGTWTPEEDALLKRCIEKHGEGKWGRISHFAGLNRCRKSCRLRWLNYLKPNIKRGSFGEDEEDLILRLHKLLGNRWSLIAGRLPGRTANDVKNHWNSHLSKKFKSAQKRAGLHKSDIELMRPSPKTIPANWTWSGTGTVMAPEVQHKETMREDHESSMDHNTLYEIESKLMEELQTNVGSELIGGLGVDEVIMDGEIEWESWFFDIDLWS